MVRPIPLGLDNDKYEEGEEEEEEEEKKPMK